MQFTALSMLNEKLTESIREKDTHIKETHRRMLAEMDSSKRIERELNKVKAEKGQVEDWLEREKVMRVNMEVMQGQMR